ncbi:PREDICTED: 39S ribosomal protein L53, mitochondrial [Dinoponera quadriceps]|uniref:Large ribosomal subunit protein mL53 n=1 Tax=Dinoponera quadriceps TaxID=609295 RepID=A0A6P3XCT9_DINQU|nr:PREDICTED: 39S ribosomal protein L53, mitochondrial [Dinoponera quadriceps]XP_014476222.1 PREDICTED: 39S ribosomal protein L53, mitochondrial [Dinoponera quadriceps]
MSIPFSGTRTRSGGLISAIVKQLKRVSLKPVKRIDVRLDPFHENVKSTRDFLFYISAPKIGATNPYCSLKTDIVCDRSDPSITFSLQSGEKVVFKTPLLTCLNILELYNKHISSLVPPDPAELEAKEEKKKKRRKKIKIKEGSKRRGVFL